MASFVTVTNLQDESEIVNLDHVVAIRLFNKDHPESGSNLYFDNPQAMKELHVKEPLTYFLPSKLTG